MSLIREIRSASASTTVSLAARAVDLEDQEVGLLLAGLLDALGQVPDHHRVQRTFEVDPHRAEQLAERRVVDAPTGRRSGRCSRTSSGVSAVRLQKPSSRARCAVEHAAQAAVPGGPFLDHLVRLLERVEVLGQDVMHGLVGRADQPEVGVAIEHSQQQVGVAGLADGQMPDLLAIRRRSNGWPSGVIGPRLDRGPMTISVHAMTGRTA